MNHEQAMIVLESASDHWPFDPAILAGQLRSSSIAMYRRDMSAYLAYVQAQALDAWQASTFACWRTALAEASQLSPHTINRMLSAVKRLLREGAEQGYVSHELAAAFQNCKGVQVRARKRALKTTRAHAHQFRGHASPV
jgi:site-specific recombinase XerD